MGRKLEWNLASNWQQLDLIFEDYLRYWPYCYLCSSTSLWSMQKAMQKPSRLCLFYLFSSVCSVLQHLLQALAWKKLDNGMSQLAAESSFPHLNLARRERTCTFFMPVMAVSVLHASFVPYSIHFLCAEFQQENWITAVFPQDTLAEVVSRRSWRTDVGWQVTFLHISYGTYTYVTHLTYLWCTVILSVICTFSLSLYWHFASLRQGSFWQLPVRPAGARAESRGRGGGAPKAQKTNPKSRKTKTDQNSSRNHSKSKNCSKRIDFA